MNISWFLREKIKDEWDQIWMNEQFIGANCYVIWEIKFTSLDSLR